MKNKLFLKPNPMEEVLDIPRVMGLDLELQKEHDEDPRNFAYESLALGGPLPLEFSIGDGFITNQRQIDSCVGHAVAGAKSEQEKKDISPRDLWAQCKEEQGYQGYGTTINIAMKKVVSPGVCDAGLIDEDCTVARDVYMKPQRNSVVLASQLQNKGQSFWFIRPEAYSVIKEALMSENISLVTSLKWFDEYNRPVDGYLPVGKTPGQGHCVRLCGWFRNAAGETVYDFKNSFGKKWGKNGHFFIREIDLPRYGFGLFYVLVDMPRNVADIVVKYAGKIVKAPNDAKIYYIEKDKKRHIENELAFWLFTNRELKDVETITPEDLNVFGDGAQIKVSDFDPTLLRVIKNMGELYNSNPEHAKNLFNF